MRLNPAQQEAMRQLYWQLIRSCGLSRRWESRRTGELLPQGVFKSSHVWPGTRNMLQLELRHRLPAVSLDCSHGTLFGARSFCCAKQVCARSTFKIVQHMVLPRQHKSGEQ